MRLIKLLNILCEAKEPITVKELSKQLNVSGRTIRNDLDKIQDNIVNHELEIIRKPKIGVVLAGSEQAKDNFYLYLENKTKHNQVEISKTEREILIMLELLDEGKFRHKQYFCNKYYISNSQIEKDFYKINIWLREHNLNLVNNNQGYTILGEEIDLRNTYSILIMLLNNDNHELYNILDLKLKEIYRKCKLILKKIESKYCFTFNKYELKNFSFHIAISIQRIKLNKVITGSATDENFKLSDVRDQELFTYLIKQLEKEFKLKFNLNEANFIKMHLIGLTLENHTFSLNETSLKYLKNASENIVNDFLMNFEQIVGIDLCNNQTFKDLLKRHIESSVYRIKYGLNIYNPLLDEIKNKYVVIFELCKIINQSFDKYLNKTANDDEIAFIALHVYMAIENIKDIINIAVVCPVGGGISRFLSIKLKDNFPKVNFISYSSEEIQKDESNFIDVIISTVEIKVNKPCVLVSPLLTEQEINSIKILIRNKENQNKNYLSINNVLVMEKANDKSEVLQEMANILYSYRYVDDKFFEGVLYREKIGSTEIGGGIVLTHGLHENVLKTQICFCKINNPIIWNEEKVSFIVLMAIAKEDSKKCVSCFEWIYKMLNKSKKMEEIISKTNAEEIYRLLIKEKN